MNDLFKMTTMRFASVLALLALGRATATARFQLPETLEELRLYIKILLDPLYAHNPVCSNASEPFLLRYDTNETSQEVYPVCLSEDELFARRADMSICNTKVTLGLPYGGGCSQHNFLDRTGPGNLKLLSTFDDLSSRDDIIAVPIHRNVPYYHGTIDDSPDFPTEMYYTEAKYLPCEMITMTQNAQKNTDTRAENGRTGYCKVEDVVKSNLCWTGVGQESDQGKMLDGTGFSTPEPCDVMQHLQNKGFHKYNDISIYNTPGIFSQAKQIKVEKKRQAASKEALQQACKFDTVVTLQNLTTESWYTGDGGSSSNGYWANIGNVDKCSQSKNCFDMDANACSADSDDCSVYNVKKYSSKNTDKCFHKKITRTWDPAISVTYKKPPVNAWQRSENYYTFTPSRRNPTGSNACDDSSNHVACVQACYERCRDMKFPAFSVNNDRECRCSDYSYNVCPENHWFGGGARKSFTISPHCGQDEACIEKTRYSDELRPCDFSAEYRKHKCMETCAGENALFMTITKSGVCLCSKKKAGATNAAIRFDTNDVCPWSTATRVHTDRSGRMANKGYEGNSFVTTEDIFTYQLKYNSYYEDERTPTDGIIICKNGTPIEELKNWYYRLTGDSLEETVTLSELKQLYQDLTI